MVASISALVSATQAARYYPEDDYFAEGGTAPSAWLGQAAVQLGLEGAVDPVVFATALAGTLPNGVTLGTIRNGERQHRPGWDVTFSAPKSVSIMALVAGDRRLLEEHDRAANAALEFLEAHGAMTRIRDGQVVRSEATGSLLAASFRHTTSRALDPQLHTHNVILNSTVDVGGVWRSLDSRSLYQLQKDAGAVYRQALARGARGLGYEIYEGKDSTFELAGVPETAIREYSRRAGQIVAALADRGKCRNTASAAEKAIATLDTRDPKIAAGQSTIVDSWRKRANEIGFDVASRAEVVAASITRAARVNGLAAKGEAEAAAASAVRFAAQKLSEREAVVSAAALEREAGQTAFGRAGRDEIVAAIARAERAGDLVARTYVDRCRGERAGFTTREAIRNEEQMLVLECSGRGHASPISNRIEAARTVEAAASRARRDGHRWTEDQRRAAIGVLASSNAIVGVQGRAGTAKTTTVLRTVSAVMKQQGQHVRAFAPTASAARLLGKEISAEADTVAKLLMLGDRVVREAKHRPEAWIVDEASMVSARDMARVTQLARQANARLILVGDTKQLGSVEAGCAFGQLQDAGMETFKLEEIVRQSNPLTREAVEAAIAGDARAAFDALDRGGGHVVEIGDAGARYIHMAQEFARLSRTERDATLVVDPTREGREALTSAIRMELRADGTLTGEALEIVTLEARGLTKAEAAHAKHYTVGDTIVFTRDYAARNVVRGEGYQVVRIDPAANRIELQARSGEAVDWQLNKWGRSTAQSFRSVACEFQVGDRIQFTRNQREIDRANGDQGVIVAVDPISRTLMVKREDGRACVLSVDETRDRHIRHGWVRTLYSSQGATADRVIAHLESFRANTVDARSAYVALSRARCYSSVYTDSRSDLVDALELRNGDRQTALAPIAAVARNTAMAIADLALG